MGNCIQGNNVCCMGNLGIFVHQRSPAPIPRHGKEIQQSYNLFMPDIATSNEVRALESVV